MVPGQTETVSPLRLNHFSTSQHSTIIVLPFDRNNRFWVDFARVQTIGFSFPHGLNQMVLCCFNMAAHDHRCSGSTFKEKQIIIRNENYYWGMLLFKIFIVTLLSISRILTLINTIYYLKVVNICYVFTRKHKSDDNQSS